MLSCVWLFVTQGLQPTRVHGIFQVRVLEWGAISFCVRGQNSYLDFWDRRLYIKWCRKSAQFRYGVQSCRSHGPLQNQEDVIFQGVVLLMLRECCSFCPGLSLLLLLWLYEVLVAVPRIVSVVACGIEFSAPGWNLGPCIKSVES